MISFSNVSKIYPESPSSRPAVSDVNFRISRGDRLGIIGGNGAGKSTLIRLASGVEKPSLGQVTRRMSCSWPLAFGGAFQSTLTGDDNIRFICRIYSVPFERIKRFVDDFSELGSFLRAPVRTYSSGMRAKFAFALSLAIEFDCLLIDEVIAVGDARFREKCHRAVTSRADQSMIFVSHDFGMVQLYCNRFALMNAGRLKEFHSFEEAVAASANGLNVL